MCNTILIWDTKILCIFQFWNFVVHLTVYSWINGLKLNDDEHAIMKLILFPTFVPEYLRKVNESSDPFEIDEKHKLTEEQKQKIEEQKEELEQHWKEFASANRRRLMDEYDAVFAPPRLIHRSFSADTLAMSECEMDIPLDERM